MPLDSIGAVPARPPALGRHTAGALLFALGLGAAAWAFWPGAEPALRDAAAAPGTVDALARFAPQQLDPATVASLIAGGPSVRAVVVHLRDPSCACAALADAHLEALKLRHGGDAVLFAVAEAPGSAAPAPRGLGRLPRLAVADAARLWASVPAAPAVAVFDGRGEPLYVGPYADGGRCSAARGGSVDAVLAAVRDGQPVPASGGLASGCFCPRVGRAQSLAGAPPAGVLSH